MLPDRQPRRRRRPAFSCLECRRRKIKCNRSEPCSHCVSSKLKCLYKVYNDDPVEQLPLRPAGSQEETPSSSTYTPSSASSSFPLNQLQQLSTNRPTIEHDIHPSRSPATISSLAEAIEVARAVAAVEEERNNTLNNATPDNPNTQPPTSTRNTGPSHVGSSQQGQNLNKPSVPSPMGTLSDSSQDILARQLGLRGSQIILNKTRVPGWSLRMGKAQEFAAIFNCYVAAAASAKGDSSKDKDTEIGAIYSQIWSLLQKCKNVARCTKLGRPSRWLVYPEFDLTPPTRELADSMAALYFRYYESTYRIIHAPTFWAEYQKFWDHPESATMGLRLKVLLVVGIGSSLSDHREQDAGFRNTVNQWVYAAQTWLSGPLEKDRLDIAGIQIYCLTILARQIFSIGGDLVWVSVGSLINMAMQIGFHRDPTHLPAMSTLQAEIRRRLWATILEMVVQSSLDSAMLPRISLEDFDTQAPSNVDDDEIDETTTEIQSQPKDTYTSASIQLILLDLLPARLRILRLLNGLHTELSYMDALTLSSEITDIYRACSSIMRSNELSSVTPFHRNLLDYLVRRFLIPLHSPFASEARTNPLLYYSLKITLDSAITLISPEPDECFSRLMAIGGGMFREGFRYAISIVTRELLAEIEAQRIDGTLGRNSQYVGSLKKTVKDMISLSLERVRQGETNVKGPMFLSMIMAQVEAVEAGIPYELKIAQSAKDSLELCFDLLQERAGTVSSQCPNTCLTPSHDGVQGGYGMDFDFDFDFLMPDASVST